jgi:hypothetical protein
MRKVCFLVVVCGLALGALWVYSPAQGGPGMNARHPHIHQAMRKLRAARADLAKAPPIFQGHRKNAMALIDKAIGELQIALKVAPRGHHPHHHHHATAR